MTVLLIIFAAIAVIWVLAYYRLPAIAWTVAIAIGLALITHYACPCRCSAQQGRP